MKAGKLGLLSVALVFGLSACDMLGGPDPVDPNPNPTPPPSGGTGSGGVTPPPTTDPGTGGPEGTFGVSLSADGTFTNDADENITDDSDPRIITVSAGETFYAQAAFSDGDGVASIVVNLVNSEPAGLRAPLVEGQDVKGFTLGAPTGDCDLGTATTVTCVYPITVTAGTVDISELPDAGDEFAYVFRTTATDSVGEESTQKIRGYVNID